MKTLQELKDARLVELATNAKEWKIKERRALHSLFKVVIYRDLYLGTLPEYIRTCNIFQWYLAKVCAWAKKQNTCKMWVMASGIATGISFGAILLMTSAGVPLVEQLWAIIIWAISAFILTLSTVKLF